MTFQAPPTKLANTCKLLTLRSDLALPGPNATRRTFQLSRLTNPPGVDFRVSLVQLRVPHIYKNTPRALTFRATINGSLVTLTIPAGHYTPTSFTTTLNVLYPRTPAQFTYDPVTLTMSFAKPISWANDAAADLNQVWTQLGIPVGSTGSYSKSSIPVSLNDLSGLTVFCDWGIDQFPFGGRLYCTGVTEAYGTSITRDVYNTSCWYLVPDSQLDSITIWLADQNAKDISTTYVDTSSEDAANYSPTWSVTLAIEPILTKSSSSILHIAR